MSYFLHYIQEIKNLEKQGATIFCIGSSVLNRPIVCIKIGDGKKKLFIQSAIHAREFVTCDLLLKLIKDMLKRPPKDSVFVVPLSNPDGVCLAKNGLKSFDCLKEDIEACNGIAFFAKKAPPSVFKIKKLQKSIQKINNFSTDFSLWKANIKGVDLNVNFDAKWGTGSQNVFKPASENFVGPHPNSEPETKALAEFVKVLKPNMTISYHSKGEVIFYDFHQKGKQKKRDKLFANVISKTTGYKIQKSWRSAGGFKDFCIEKLKIPSLTIEVGKNSLCHPITKKHLFHIYTQNQNVIEKSLALLDSFKV